MFHMILSGGHEFELETMSTLVLELNMATEMTEDEFYDNGDLATNIASILGIELSRIKLVNVIQETSLTRVARRSRLAYRTYPKPRTTRSIQFLTTVQFEISVDDIDHSVERLNDEVAGEIIKKSHDIVLAAKEVVVQTDPSATVASEIAIAIAPTEPEKESVAEPITEQLGIFNNTEFLDFIEVQALLQKELDTVPLEFLKTSQDNIEAQESLNQEKHDFVVYKTPQDMYLYSKPNQQQILDEPFFEPFVLIMRDEHGDNLINVGLVSSLWSVTISIASASLYGARPAVLTGNTSASFVLGTGKAIFDDFRISGDVNDCQFRFTVTNPIDSDVFDLLSDRVLFMPASSVPTSTGFEGMIFGYSESWTSDCSRVCLSPARSIPGYTVPTKCNDVSSCSTSFSTCNPDGCTCDLTSIPLYSTISPSDYTTGSCSASHMEIRIDKCIANYFGFMLTDLFVNGPAKTDQFSNLQTTLTNRCRGELVYDNGPEYVFRLENTLNDCGSVVHKNSTAIVYTNAVQGQVSLGHSTATIFRNRQFYVAMGCTVELNVTASNSFIVDLGNFEDFSKKRMKPDITTINFYTDSTYQTKAWDNYTFHVPERVYLGQLNYSLKLSHHIYRIGAVAIYTNDPGQSLLGDVSE